MDIAESLPAGLFKELSSRISAVEMSQVEAVSAIVVVSAASPKTARAMVCA